MDDGIGDGDDGIGDGRRDGLSITPPSQVTSIYYQDKTPILEYFHSKQTK